MKTIKVKKQEKISMISLSRTKNLNAIHTLMLDEISAVLDSMKDSRVLIIKGEGKAFSVGADIKEMKEMDSLKIKAFSKKGQDLFNIIEDLHMLTIACIDGYCMGGGLELASTCDLRISSPESKFSLPELKLGVVPGFGAFFRIQELVGFSDFKKMLFTGEVMDAKRAKDIGLINIVSDDPLKKANQIAKNFIEDLSFNAFFHAKKTINFALKKHRKEILEKENQAIAETFSHLDKKTGMDSFLKKQKPEFE
ncbi:hypothetical protein GF327_08530 [Candidatus Woesearchaeota archaeon]|nr:hypothetical protein [Candidatus Woesearchaeota archaeon]